ncbi:hypothetical protein ASD12_31720 [Mesorhizobium sp. Root102]|uniref:hypothetical protein n=1 Tax=Mesorhizobium sp. Root172 TaxID=1736481 RepID=UPI0006F1E8BC|nr:hypothetical protein [Mesorhizobium sp. Root172]KQU85516.1 hypothetical protein ASD12_31720 [Mesorhizobium sp. Root102]
MPIYAELQFPAFDQRQFVEATIVPVGEDQAPLIEQTNETVRRINAIAGPAILPEAQAVIPQCGRLPGVYGKAKISNRAAMVPPCRS